jgi:hypothetical protein
MLSASPPANNKKRRIKMTTDTLQQQAIQDSIVRTQADQTEQYTLWQILGIVALVTLPMALLAWVVAPAIIPYSPLHPGITYWLLMIAGMAWQFVVSLVIVYRELGTLRWSAIRQRAWLQTPRDPKTDQPNPRLYWWVLLYLQLFHGRGISLPRRALAQDAGRFRQVQLLPFQLPNREGHRGREPRSKHGGAPPRCFPPEPASRPLSRSLVN